MIADLIKLANLLDEKKLSGFADRIDRIINKYADEKGEVSRKMDAELNIDSMLSRDKRIDELTRLVEEKYEAGDRLQVTLERIDSALEVESLGPHQYEARDLREEVVQKLEALSQEVDLISAELSDLAFNQGRTKRSLRAGSGFLGSSDNPYDLPGDADIAQERIDKGIPSTAWNIKNIGEAAELEMAEANLFADHIVKESQATGRISVLKLLLQDILREHGYTVGSPGNPENIRDDGSEKVIDIPLDVASDRWGNTNQAWFAFANYILRMPEIATDWQSIASTIGTGYSDGMNGMMDLLRDYKSGGRAQVGVDLATGGIAEQTEELQQEITTRREKHEFDKEHIINPEGTHRLADAIRFDSERERLEGEARIADQERASRAAELLAQNEAESGSGDVARLESAETIWTNAGWTQARNSDGTVAYYLDDKGQRLDDIRRRPRGPGGERMANIGEAPLKRIKWQQAEASRMENPLSDHTVIALSNEFSNNSFKYVNRG